MIVTLVLIAALVFAIIELVLTRGKDLAAWSAGLIAVALLYAKL